MRKNQKLKLQIRINNNPQIYMDSVEFEIKNKTDPQIPDEPS